MVSEFPCETTHPTLVDTNQARELQHLRQTVLGTSISCQHCKSRGTTDDNPSPVVSPISSSSESYASFLDDGSAPDQQQEESDQSEGLQENETRNYSGNTHVTRHDDADTTFKVEFNPDTKVALKLNLEHSLTKNAVWTYVAFSMDGKYLATVSEPGIMQIFDVKTGKCLR